ncbi:MAG: tetratricopeptide repeat protein, partial [Rhodospirillales bacterium]|nr:tetratricopeptide repeat protein [Rhodospirillales bacterium]
MRPLTRILDFEKWRDNDTDNFIPQRRRLQFTVIRAEGPEKEKTRLDMARYYLSLGFGAEALGVLASVARERPGIRNDPQFRALHGSANFLMARKKEAEEDWYHESLNNNDEATFWRASMAALDGDYVRASRVLRRMTGILRSYPKALQLPLSLIAAESAIEVGDLRQATHIIEVLTLDEPGPAEAAQIAYVEGRLMELSGDFEGAIAKWEDVELGPHRPSQAKAVVAKNEMLLELEKITPAEAIEEYEKLRFTWRGDEFEFALLRRLGQLYIQENDYRNGLRTLRQAATHFRDHAEAKAVTQEMTDAFGRLYLEGAADVLPPVTAIALYDEFKELTPPGDKGDEMIRKLADRLVAVDLLDR